MQNLEYTPRGAEEALALNARSRSGAAFGSDFGWRGWQAVPRRGRFAIIL